jgi:hypothetical protein
MGRNQGKFSIKWPYRAIHYNFLFFPPHNSITQKQKDFRSYPVRENGCVIRTQPESIRTQVSGIKT